MAKDLGFNRRSGLEYWAGQNPAIWGNNHGAKMFFDSEAFPDNEDIEVESLSRIIDHWRGVQSRLPV